MSASVGSLATRPPETSTGTTVVRPDGTPPRVLLAEDSMAARVLTAALLRRMGCAVDAVEHGEDAVSHIQASDYDVVLMDIEMPVMDGFLAAREIRSLGGAAARTPIVALSAFVSDTQKTSNWRNSFDLSLAKPAGREQLRGVLQAMLHRDAPCAELCPQKDRVQPHECALIDLAELTDLTEPMPKGEVATLLATASVDLDEIAKRLTAALDSGDADQARKAAHKIRGIAASFAAPRAADLARRLEEAGEAISDLGAQLAACTTETAKLLRKAAVA